MLILEIFLLTVFLFEYKFNHKVEVEKGILKQESKEILQRFFKELRLKRKEK